MLRTAGQGGFDGGGGVFDGDQIIVEHREEARNGELVVALIDGHETTLKRIEQHPGRIILHAANAGYALMEFVPERVTIQGVIVGLIRSYR